VIFATRLDMTLTAAGDGDRIVRCRAPKPGTTQFRRRSVGWTVAVALAPRFRARSGAPSTTSSSLRRSHEPRRHASARRRVDRGGGRRGSSPRTEQAARRSIISTPTASLPTSLTREGALTARLTAHVPPAPDVRFASPTAVVKQHHRAPRSNNYRTPDGPARHGRPWPKKDSMGMEYIGCYERRRYRRRAVKLFAGEKSSAPAQIRSPGDAGDPRDDPRAWHDCARRAR